MASGERVECALIAVCAGGDGLRVLGDIFKKAPPSGRGIDQFLKEIGVAAVNQHVAKNTHETTGGTAGDAGAAKLVQNTHGLGAKQKCNGLTVVRRRVVERNFARTGSRQFAYARKRQHVSSVTNSLLARFIRNLAGRLMWSLSNRARNGEKGLSFPTTVWDDGPVAANPRSQFPQPIPFDGVEEVFHQFVRVVGATVGQFPFGQRPDSFIGMSRGAYEGEYSVRRRRCWPGSCSTGLPLCGGVIQHGIFGIAVGRNLPLKWIFP
jgi:hypothetical protein